MCLISFGFELGSGLIERNEFVEVFFEILSGLVSLVVQAKYAVFVFFIAHEHDKGVFVFESNDFEVFIVDGLNALFDLSVEFCFVFAADLSQLKEMLIQQRSRVMLEHGILFDDDFFEITRAFHRFDRCIADLIEKRVFADGVLLPDFILIDLLEIVLLSLDDFLALGSRLVLE